MDWSWLQTILAEAPITVIAAVLIGLMFLAIRTGAWLRGRQAVGPEVEEREEEGQEGYVVSALLGLLALLLGFTFSLAVDRYEIRRALVLQEANALGTAYLRSQLLPEPHRTRISELLSAYTENRIRLAKVSRPRDTGLLARNDALLTDMWDEAASVWPVIRGLDFSTAYIDSLNQVIELDTARKAARLAHVPAAVYGVLLLYAVAAAGVLGYVLKRARTRRSAGALLVLLSMTLLLIIDIDRPLGGGVVEGQLPMELLQDNLQDWRAHRFGRSGIGAPAVSSPSPAATSP